MEWSGDEKFHKKVTRALGYQTIDTINFIRLYVNFRAVSLPEHWSDSLKGGTLRRECRDKI